MTTVFIGGSRHLRYLDEQVLGELKRTKDENHEVLVGDAAGADNLIQQYFAREERYDNVVVYHMGDRARHNLGDWNTKPVPASGARKNFKYFARKDEKMSMRADYGLMLWDGKSKGTLNNVLNLLEGGKRATVYFSPDQLLTTVSTVGQLEALLKKCNREMMDYFDKKIELKKRIRMLSQQTDLLASRQDAGAVHAVPG